MNKYRKRWVLLSLKMYKYLCFLRYEIDFSKLTKMFCTAEVAELENSTVRVEQQVLRFDVPVTNSMRMNVGKRPRERM